MILLPFLGLSLLYKSPLLHYWNKPKWNEMIHFPLTWSGFHQVKIKYFLLIALAINIVTFTPFMIRNGWGFIQDIWLVAIIFSITNAVFEEFIWRGVLLSRFSEQLGDKWAVIITSLGFGLQHYSLGFSWAMCITFSIGGFFYGGVTVQSKSIIPALIWHITFNFLMVFSGLIISNV
ncbi:CPBP family intramembrane glutamic endopeptidase [Aneurinibacillus soli]|uniref:CPBP family intramembrane glutamic endopeptidase n=1 Tax=Aneurinibacillus soli TaxID=1500254 RepID=UPI0021ACB1D5|nr:CPBP family intramembrane glutamic endopeptidase [Aneurinibacillus soli]